MDKHEFIKFLKEKVQNNANAIDALRERSYTASEEDEDILMEQFGFLLGKDEAYNEIAFWLLDNF